MTGFDSKRKIALDRLDDDDIQIYAQPTLKGESMTKDEAITLEALKYAASKGCSISMLQEISAPFTIKSTLAQPEQEPVAWAIYDRRGGSKSLHWPEQHSPNGNATMFDAVPLVLQRPWVGLTDDEVEDCMEMSIQKTCRAIEAKLKEKNT